MVSAITNFIASISYTWAFLHFPLCFSLSDSVKNKSQAILLTRRLISFNGYLIFKLKSSNGLQGLTYLALWFLWFHLILLSHLWTPQTPGFFSLRQEYSFLRVSEMSLFFIINTVPWDRTHPWDIITPLTPSLPSGLYFYVSFSMSPFLIILLKL